MIKLVLQPARLKDARLPLIAMLNKRERLLAQQENFLEQRASTELKRSSPSLRFATSVAVPSIPSL